MLRFARLALVRTEKFDETSCVVCARKPNSKSYFVAGSHAFSSKDGHSVIAATKKANINHQGGLGGGRFHCTVRIAPFGARTSVSSWKSGMLPIRVTTAVNRNTAMSYELLDFFLNRPLNSLQTQSTNHGEEAPDISVLMRAWRAKHTIFAHQSDDWRGYGAQNTSKI